jgi:hypothetical protein
VIAKEQKDQKSYWQNEPKSLGIEPKRKNELNGKEELFTLADNIKRIYYQDYKSAYNRYKEINESHFDYIIKRCGSTIYGSIWRKPGDSMPFYVWLC